MIKKSTLLYIVILIVIICIIVNDMYKNREIIKNDINTVEPLFYIQYDELKDKYPVKTSSVPIYVFYHICTTNMKIVDEQMGEIVNSGLYSIATKLFYGCNCSSCDTILEEYMKQYDKFLPLKSAIIPDKKTYENGTVNAMINYAKESTEKFYALYIHTKGTSNVSEAQQAWRRIMMYWLVSNHKLCIDILNRDFYTVGLFYTTCAEICRKHYSGNFWWADSNYLKLLTPIKIMDNRYNAEMILFTKHQQQKHISLLKEIAQFGSLYMFSHQIKPSENPYLAII